MIDSSPQSQRKENAGYSHLYKNKMKVNTSFINLVEYTLLSKRILITDLLQPPESLAQARDKRNRDLKKRKLMKIYQKGLN